MTVLGPIFRDVGEFPGYRIGRDGTVWTEHPRGNPRGEPGAWRRILCHGGGNGEYPGVQLFRDGKFHTRYVHRLVLETFAGPCPPGHECCHDDGIPTNNGLPNLYWGTRAQNCADTARHGRAHRGSRHHFAKLNERDVSEIHLMRREMPHIKVSDLAILFGVHEATIRAVVKGSNWSWLTGAGRGV